MVIVTPNAQFVSEMLPASVGMPGGGSPSPEYPRR